MSSQDPTDDFKPLEHVSTEDLLAIRSGDLERVSTPGLALLRAHLSPAPAGQPLWQNAEPGGPAGPGETRDPVTGFRRTAGSVPGIAPELAPDTSMRHQAAEWAMRRGGEFGQAAEQAGEAVNTLGERTLGQFSPQGFQRFAEHPIDASFSQLMALANAGGRTLGAPLAPIVGGVGEALPAPYPDASGPQFMQDVRRDPLGAAARMGSTYLQTPLTAPGTIQRTLEPSFGREGSEAATNALLMSMPFLGRAAGAVGGGLGAAADAARARLSPAYAAERVPLGRPDIQPPSVPLPPEVRTVEPPPAPLDIAPRVIKPPKTFETGAILRQGEPGGPTASFRPAEPPPGSTVPKPDATVPAPATMQELPPELLEMGKAWGRPAKTEGTIPTGTERALEGEPIESIAAAAAKASGRNLVPYTDKSGNEFVIDADQVKPSFLRYLDVPQKGRSPWRLVNGLDAKPAEPTEAVTVRDRTGREVRTVLTDSPAASAAAEAAQPRSLRTERVPATPEGLAPVLAERGREPVPVEPAKVAADQGERTGPIGGEQGAESGQMKAATEAVPAPVERSSAAAPPPVETTPPTVEPRPTTMDASAEAHEARVQQLMTEEGLPRRRAEKIAKAEERDFENGPRGMPAQAPTGPGSALPPKPTSQGFQPGTPGEMVRESEIVHQLRDTANVPVRVGRVKKPGVLGFFKPHEEVIRAKFANDVSTVAHEVGHALEDQALGGDVRRAPGVPRAVLVDLARLGRRLYGTRKPATSYAAEGLAELVREHVEPSQSTKNAQPATRAWLESLLSDHPEFRDGLVEAKRMAQRYRDQGTDLQAEAAIHETVPHETSLPTRTILGRTKRSALSFMDSLRARWDDRAMALRRMEEEGSGGKVSPTGPTAMARARLRGRDIAARNYIQHGVAWEGGQLVRGDGLADVFGDVVAKGKYGQTRRYIAAMREFDYQSAGLSFEGKADKWKAIRDRYGSDPEIAAAQKRFVQWQQRFFRKTMVDDAGLPAKYVDEVIAQNPNFAKIVRVFEGETPGAAESGGRSIANTPQPFKRRTGSKREFFDPVDSAIGEITRLAHVGARMRTARAIGEYGVNTQGIGRWMEEVPPEKAPTTFSIEEIAKQFEDLTGVKLPKDLHDKTMTVWRNARLPLWDDEFMALTGKDGKPRTFQMDPELGRFLNDLQTPKEIGAILKTMQAVARGVKLGATGLNLAFSTLANPWRDAFNYMVNTVEGNPVRSGAALARGYKESVAGGKVKEMYRASGAEAGGYIGMERRSLTRLRQEATAKGAAAKTIVTLRHPIDAFKALSSIPESAPRIAEFMNDLRRQGVDFDHGKLPTEEQALRAANAAAEVTIDFGRAGSAAEVVNSVIPFFNPILRGIEKTLTMAKNRPAALAVRGLAYVTLPSLALWAKNRKDAYYRGLEEHDKNTYWWVSLPGGRWLRLPKPQEYGLGFGSAIERALEYAQEKDPKALKEAGVDMLSQLAPSLLPPAAEIPLEVASNTVRYTGRPIVPRSLEKAPTEQQFTERTSATAKKIGKILGVAPAYIDHILYRASGGLASDVIGAAESAAGVGPPESKLKLPILGRFQGSGLESKDYRGFWDIRRKLEEAEQETQVVRRDASRAREGALRRPDPRGMTALENLAKQLQTMRRAAIAEKDSAQQQVKMEAFRSQATRAREVAERILRGAGGSP